MIVKVMLLLTGGGPMVILTSSESPTAPAFLKELRSKGIDKFIAYDIPIELAKERYGTHFASVVGDVHAKTAGTTGCGVTPDGLEPELAPVSTGHPA